MSTILSDGIRRARRPHLCDQCLQEIKFDERYRRQVFVDPQLHTYRAHEDCDAAATRKDKYGNYHPLWDEPSILCNDIDREDYGWLLAEFPAVADRFGIQGAALPAEAAE
jgi:hypothetical protein